MTLRLLDLAPPWPSLRGWPPSWRHRGVRPRLLRPGWLWAPKAKNRAEASPQTTEPRLAASARSPPSPAGRQDDVAEPRMVWPRPGARTTRRRAEASLPPGRRAYHRRFARHHRPQGGRTTDHPSAWLGLQQGRVGGLYSGAFLQGWPTPGDGPAPAAHNACECRSQQCRRLVRCTSGEDPKDPRWPRQRGAPSARPAPDVEAPGQGSPTSRQRR